MAQLTVPQASDLTEIGNTLGQWQSDGAPIHLHPGDLGWYSLRGAETTARDLRVWRTGGDILAVGLLDGANLLRLAVHPSLRRDDSLARDIQSDIESPNTRVFADGAAIVEARGAAALCDRLTESGWATDEPWTPLQRDLSQAVEAPDMTVVTASAGDAEAWASIHWSAFRAHRTQRTTPQSSPAVGERCRPARSLPAHGTCWDMTTPACLSLWPRSGPPAPHVPDSSNPSRSTATTKVVDSERPSRSPLRRTCSKWDRQRHPSQPKARTPARLRPMSQPVSFPTPR